MRPESAGFRPDCASPLFEAVFRETAHSHRPRLHLVTQPETLPFRHSPIWSGYDAHISADSRIARLGLPASKSRVLPLEPPQFGSNPNFFAILFLLQKQRLMKCRLILKWLEVRVSPGGQCNSELLAQVRRERIEAD